MSNSKRTFLALGGAMLAVVFSLLAMGVAQAGVPAQGASPDTGSAWKRWQLTGTGLTDVDAVSATDAWTVGSDGLFAHWDGARWTAVDNTKVIGTSSVYAVDMLASNAVWATSTQGRMLRYDGAVWALEPSNLPATVSMFALSMVSPTYGWAAGTAANFARYDGTGWTQVVPGGTLTSTINGLDMVDVNNGWAVTGASDQSGIVGKIARWDGASWQVVYTGNRILYDVDMLSATYGWAVGLGGTLLNWNGTAWTVAPPPTSCTNSCAAASIRGVYTVSQTDAWAVGSTNISDSNIWHWDGALWTEVAQPNQAPLQSVKMISGSDGFAVGDRGTVHRYNGTGAQWQVSNSHWTSNGFYGLDFLTPSDGWTVGVLNASPPADGLQKWNGSDWTSYPQPSNQGGPIRDVEMVATNAVWAVGSQVILRWDGSAWTSTASTGNFLQAMSMLSATDGWAVGTGGDIVHFDGTSWTNYTTPTTTNLWSIDMVDANNGWAGGTLGLMLRYQNGVWTPLSPNPGASTIEAIHMLNANEGWAVGYNGMILRYQNGSWTQVGSPTSENLLGVHAVSSTEAWAVGNEGTILRFQNGAWNLILSPTGRNLRDVYVFPDGSGWAVGESPGPKIYLGNVIVGGTATPTPTIVPPTATRTSTSVAPSSTSTIVAPTSTRTAVPPTVTAIIEPTSTATRTSTATAVVPTSTGTSVLPTSTRTTVLPTITLTSTMAAPSSTSIASPTPGQPTVSSTSIPPSVTRVATASPSPTQECGPAWRIVTAPNIGPLNAVEAISANDVWAVGRGILHWDGIQWSQVPIPVDSTATLYGISAISPDDVWVVGDYVNIIRVTLTLHWDGVAWSLISSPNSIDDSANFLSGVDAIATNDVWAVGSSLNTRRISPLTLHWDGTAWSRVSSPDSGYYSVSALSSNDVWAVGSRGGLPTSDRTNVTAHWNGAQWSNVPSLNMGSRINSLSEVSAVSPNDVWAVGSYQNETASRQETMVMRWDGVQWSVVFSANLSSGSPSISALASNDVWVVDGNSIMHWNGSAWATLPNPSPGSRLLDVDALAPRDVWAVGAAGSEPQAAGVIMRYTDQRFSDVPPTNTFYAQVECLACRGILGGYSDGTFRPNNNITRGQIAKVVSNAAGYSDAPGTPIFEDVPANNTFFEWVQRLARRGHMGGYPCGQVSGEPCNTGNLPYFRPSANATRGQLAKIVSNAAGFSEPQTGQTFTDVPEDNPFHLWVERLATRGVMGGYECGRPSEPCDAQNRAYFRPNNNVTRGQASKIVANTFFPGCQAR